MTILLLYVALSIALIIIYKMILNTTVEIDPPINKNPEPEEPIMSTPEEIIQSDEPCQVVQNPEGDFAQELAKLVNEYTEKNSNHKITFKTDDEDEDGAKVPALV